MISPFHLGSVKQTHDCRHAFIFNSETGEYLMITLVRNGRFCSRTTDSVNTEALLLSRS